MTKVTILVSPDLAEDIRLQQEAFEAVIRQTLNDLMMAEYIPNEMRIIEGRAMVVTDRPLLEARKP